MSSIFSKTNLTKFVPKKVAALAGRQALTLQKHSPTILFTAGVIGVTATVVTSSMATLKVRDILDTHHENEKMAEDLFTSGHKDYPEADYKRDRVYIWSKTAVALGKLYGPSILLGAVSIACLAGSHNILSSRNASLAAAYKTVETAFERYQERVAEEVGEDKAREFRYDLIKEEVKSNDGKTTTTKKTNVNGHKSPSMYARFFDELNPNFNRNDHQLNRMFLSAQQNYANDLLINRGHIFLNEVYDMLGMERTTAGQVVGWVISKDGTDNFVDFGIFDSDDISKRMFVNGDEPAVLLDFNVNGVVYELIGND